MSDTGTMAPLLVCPLCKTEMRLFGIEPESGERDLFTFECIECGRLDVRGVQIADVSSPALN